jgi:hypothetical protein
VAWGLSFEMLAICFQAARGVKSHFNNATALDAAVFTAMGVVISVVVLVAFFGVLHVLKSRQSIPVARREALVWGFAIFTLAAFSGATMARPTPEQRLLLMQGDASPIIGSHFVGDVEGEVKTMPLTGWNVESGDLRVAHFVGMHVIHVLLALTLLMQWRGIDQNARPSVWLVRIAAVLGLALTCVVFFQAQAGQPLVVLGSTFGWGVGMLGLCIVLVFLAILILKPPVRCHGELTHK